MEAFEIENDLVRKIMEENPEHFRIIIKKYKKLVSHIIHRLVENEMEQEELGQEIFVKIYQSLPSFRFQSNLATWITKIAYNTCLNYLRKKKTPLYEDQITAISLGESETENRNHGIEGVSSRSVLQDETLFKKEISGFLHREIKALPVQYRKIITFYHLDNMSYKEIAEVINIPEGTVKSYMFRARKILKDRLLARYKLEELCP
jgi:RNA polymerase sigma-70 factor (ECF subfamily)